MLAMILRVVFSVLAAAAVFILVFLAIFVPMLISDMHYAPHDGQGGMSGFFLGIPIATIAALGAGPYFYFLSKRRDWFSN
jgi:uncharacterized RDD family membrane protein YckC